MLSVATLGRNPFNIEHSTFVLGGTIMTLKSSRVAQIASVGSHSPWFSDICGEMTRRGYDVFAIIDSGSGNLGARLTSLGIRHYKVPMHFAESLDRARLPFYL